MNEHKSNSIRASQLGFSLPQLLIAVAIISVVSAIAVMGVTRARSSMRLSNATRQFASYVERARADAVRRHGQSSVQMLTTDTYSVTMDFGADGVVTTQTFVLENNVSFITELNTITFDWRGRVASEISVGFSNESGTANVNITGSGDITIDSEIFHDASVPDVNYNENVSGDVLPDAGATPDASPLATPTATPSPSESVDPSASPNPSPDVSPDTTATPTPTPTPATTPTPTPTATPSPTPVASPSPCLMVVAPDPLIVLQNGSGSIAAVLTNFSGTTTIQATSNNSGQIQISPDSRTISSLGSATFTVTVKKQSGSVTLESPCGSKTVTITVP